MGNRATEFNSEIEIVEVDLQPITAMQAQSIGQLLKMSNIDHEERERIEKSIDLLSEEEAVSLIIDLGMNQLDSIPSGYNYGQTDIVKFQNKMINE